MQYYWKGYSHELSGDMTHDPTTKNQNPPKIDDITQFRSISKILTNGNNEIW